jgi:hypothetical protein
MVVVMCDVCQGDIYEKQEGTSVVTFTARGQTQELDICDECLHGSFLQEARPVAKQKKVVGEFDCPGCGKSFKTPGGLTRHRTKVPHGGSQ